jgi:dTDP-4-amino-4,6-dideoxy-D-galactose acyltransferase
MSTPCEFLSWDSDFFGIRIGRVTAHRLTDASAIEIGDWASEHRVDCLYFWADPRDATTLQLAPRYGFDLVDLRVTLAGRPTPGDRSASVRCAMPDDVEALRAIARASHRDSRFYQDGRFDERRCGDLFATWIEKSCLGHAAIALVAKVDGEPAGYITGHCAGGNVGTIGLVGIDPAHRRRGCGRALVRSLLDWFAERKVALVSVVTQGRNAEALAFYQRNGLDVVRIEPGYHRWTSTPSLARPTPA